MLTLYSFLYTIAMFLMSPLFLLRREKYASGFRERLGNYPHFAKDGRPVIWLHCVSVGETNAVRPLVEKLLTEVPQHSLVISTTTRTGQELAKKLFAGKAAAVFYFPFDWKFSVRRALRNFEPSTILLMETEIWPRLIADARRSGARVAIVNARMSERSFGRYLLITGFVRSVLRRVDLVLAQAGRDAKRFAALGVEVAKLHVTGNLKFELPADVGEHSLTEELKTRFGVNGGRPLVVAASTHEPEEELILRSLSGLVPQAARLLIAPRHPDRFDYVADVLRRSSLNFVRRSAPPSEDDATADVILLDSIGELRSVYPLADVVFVGGSLVPHGGQSILEPAACGKAIVTGPFTHNFADAVRSFHLGNALVQLPEGSEAEMVSRLAAEFDSLLRDENRRDQLGEHARSVIRDNQGATQATVDALEQLIGV